MILPSLSADILHIMSKIWYVRPCIVVVLTRKDYVIEISRMGIYYGVLVGVPSCNKIRIDNRVSKLSALPSAVAKIESAHESNLAVNKK